MRFIFCVLLFFVGFHLSNAQGDSMAIHFRSMSLIQPSLLQSLNFDKGASAKKSLFSNSDFENNLPKFKTTAFFCVLENQIQQTSKIPIRMRLGSLDYTNSMEGKNPFDIEQLNRIKAPLK